MELSMDKLREYLENEGVHPSYHRLKILEYLMNHRTHPTVERIPKEPSKEIPTLSKTTIYNTLKLFVRYQGHCTGADDRREGNAIRCQYETTRAFQVYGVRGRV